MCTVCEKSVMRSDNKRFVYKILRVMNKKEARYATAYRNMSIKDLPCEVVPETPEYGEIAKFIRTNNHDLVEAGWIHCFDTLDKAEENFKRYIETTFIIRGEMDKYVIIAGYIPPNVEYKLGCNCDEGYIVTKKVVLTHEVSKPTPGLPR